MENRYIIKIDLKKKTITNAKYKQGDAFTSIIEINMVDDVSPVDITGQTVSFKFLRSDGSIATQDISNGVTIINPLNGDFQCVLESNTLSIYGIVNCEISFSDVENILSTATFNFNVTQSIGALSINYISSVANQISLWQSEITNIQAQYTEALALDANHASLEIVAGRKGEVDLSTKIGKMDAATALNDTHLAQNTKQIVDYIPQNNKGGIIFGQEYLSSFHKKIMAGTITKARCMGDSTTFGTTIVNSANIINNLLQNIAQKDGFSNFSADNAGHPSVPTSQWVSSYLDGDIASNPDIMIIRYGINDPAFLKDGTQAPINGGLMSNRVDENDFEISLRTALTRIRTAKSLSQLSIILMVPNSVSDDTYMRNESWVEKIIPKIQKAARDFQCCFINTYQCLQDSSVANASDYMDSLRLHPSDVMNLWISSLLYDVMFPKAIRAMYGNSIVNSAWVAPTLLNGWGNNDPGHEYVGYGLSMYGTDKILRLKGLISNGTLTSGTVLFNMIANCRPSNNHYITTTCATGVVTLSILTNGDVTIVTCPSNGWLTLSGINVRI